jgi:hypothetical protein
MAGEPTLRPGDESVDGWVEYLQAQLLNLAAGIVGIRDGWRPNGAFDDETEGYVRAFQRYHGIMTDGVVGEETWNMLHGNIDNVDPATDGRQPHTYVEQAPRLEWENANDYDRDNDCYVFRAMNVGSTDVSDVTVQVQRISGPVDLRTSDAAGWTDDGRPAPPGGRMHFTVSLERQLQAGEDVEIELRLPDENGGATFLPACVGDLQALARGEDPFGQPS